MRKNLFIIAGLMILLLSSLCSAALIDGLVSFWKFDEQDVSGTGTIIDIHGSNDGTNAGADNVTGKINTAYDFDSTDEISVSDFPVSPLDSRTWGSWVYLDEDTAGLKMILSQYGGTIAASGYNLIVDGSERISCGIGDGSSNVYNYAGTLSLNEWTFLNCVLVDGRVLTYKNNTLLNNISAGDGTIAVPTNPLKFGEDPSADGRNWRGIIDEVRIYNRSLSAAEINEHYNDNSGLAYPFAVDTCSCPGAGNNWEIAMSDYCNITEDCNLTTGKLSFTGSGITRINATVTTSDLGDPGSGGLLEILSNCLIWILG